MHGDAQEEQRDVRGDAMRDPVEHRLQRQPALERSPRHLDALPLLDVGRQIGGAQGAVTAVHDGHAIEALCRRNRGRVQVSAELPLLHPLGRSKEIPDIKYPEAEEGASLPARKRAGKLEPEPFLDTLPVYRYRTEHRNTRRR